MPWTAIGTLKGSDGSSGSITDVTVTPLAPGATPTVTLGGTPSARTITLGIPKGDTGDPATNFITSVAGKQGVVTLVKGDVGLANVDNTADTAKPVSTAQQTALDLKAPLASPAFTGTPTGITKAHVGLGNVDNTADSAKPVSTAQQTALNLKAASVHTHVAQDITDATATGRSLLSAASAGSARTVIGAGTSSLVIGTTSGTVPDAVVTNNAIALKAPIASPTFTGTVSGITKTMVGLGSVDNTADSAKPVSTAQQTALNLKANLASPTFTGTVTGITKAMVGLANVDNTADIDKPVSTAQTTALAAKADLVGGFVPTAQIPPLAVNEVFVVASEAAMLALTAQRGDMAIRETGRTYVLSSDSPSTLADWKEVMAAGQVTSVAGKTGVVSLAKADVGLANVDNTADADKPISTATATALSGKAATAHTHTVANITDATVTGANVLKATDAAAARTAIGAGTSSLVIGTSAGQAADAAALTSSLALKAPLASPAFTGTVTGITKAMVGLANVDNTTDANKPVSTAQQAALDLKAPLANPTFTGTVSGVTKTHVGLGNVDNTSDASKPISTATATALSGKAPTVHTHVINDVTGLQAALDSAVDNETIPQPLGNPSPGVATVAAPVDHVHAMPTLNDFDDIDLTGVADGQALVYSSAAGKIMPGAVVAEDILTGPGIDPTGVNDSTAAINTYLAALAPRTRVDLSGGIFKLSGPIVVPVAGTVLQGPGEFRWVSGIANGDALSITGEGSHVTGITLTNPNLLGSPTGARSQAIAIKANNVKVDHNTVDSFQNGIMCVSQGEIYGVIIDGNRIKDILGSGLGPNSASGYGEDRGDGITTWGSITTITNNIINCKAGYDARIGIHTEGLGGNVITPSPHDQAMTVISNNVVYGAFRRGITAEDTNQTVISGNTVADSGWWEISVVRGNQCTVIGNTILRTSGAVYTAYTPKTAAIMVYGLSIGCVVTDNNITINTPAGTSINSYIMTVATGTEDHSTDVMITNNQATILPGSGTVANGIQTDNGAVRPIIRGNRIMATTLRGIWLYAALDYQCNDNTILGGGTLPTGIEASGTLTGGTAMGNRISSVTGTAIKLYNQTDTLVIRGNVISGADRGIDTFGTTGVIHIQNNVMTTVTTPFASVPKASFSTIQSAGSNSFTQNPPSIAALGYWESADLAFTGALASDYFGVSTSINPGALRYNAYSPADGFIRITAFNPTGAAIDPASTSFLVYRTPRSSFDGRV